MKILHIITGLSAGGAETMLYKLLSNMDKKEFSNQVVSLTTEGDIAGRINGIGVGTEALDMRRRISDVRALWKLSRLIKDRKPDIIQTWMYHADLIGGLVSKSVGNIPVIWNIRHSNLDKYENKKTTLLTAKACAFFSDRIPKNIVCCSNKSKQVHERIGYSENKIYVIPNGFELDVFIPDKKAKQSIRTELGISNNKLLVGMVARYNPQKDHANLIQAVANLQKKGTDAYFLLCGKGVDHNNSELNRLIMNMGLADRFFLLGLRDDMPTITASLDVAVLSSAHGEGFPNVLGEAMACEVPCVATDVGDSALIIGKTGYIVPPRDYKALAAALSKMINMEPCDRTKLGREARTRVKDKFDITKITELYENMYGEIVFGRLDH